VILHRCVPWDRSADPAEQGGPLWFARAFQGDGRHDNPDLFACLYASGDEVGAVAEQLAPFRGTGGLAASLLRRHGLPLALATIELDDGADVVDLDDPAVLVQEGLRPSLVATRHRQVTQPQARALWESRPDAAALRWWSTFESTLVNVTVFDRAAPRLSSVATRELTTSDPSVLAAAELLGLATAAR
jgi:hypothetical protein